MTKKKPVRRGGWPKRERASLFLRLPPSLVDEIRQLAAESGVTVNVFCERLLESLVIVQRRLPRRGTLDDPMSHLGFIFDQLLARPDQNSPAVPNPSAVKPAATVTPLVPLASECSPAER